MFLSVSVLKLFGKSNEHTLCVRESDLAFRLELSEAHKCNCDIRFANADVTSEI